MTDKRYVYSADGENYMHDNPEDAMDEALSNCPEKEFAIGLELTYHKAVARDFVPADFFDVSDILEHACERADDEAGEWAEDFGYCTPAQREELETLVHAWANKTLTCAFYGIREDEEITFTVTEEMFMEYS